MGLYGNHGLIYRRRQCSRQSGINLGARARKDEFKNNNKTLKISLLTTLRICVHGENNKKKSQVVDERKLPREQHFVPVRNSDNINPETALLQLMSVQRGCFTVISFLNVSCANRSH